MNSMVMFHNYICLPEGIEASLKLSSTWVSRMVIRACGDYTKTRALGCCLNTKMWEVTANKEKKHVSISTTIYQNERFRSQTLDMMMNQRRKDQDWCDLPRVLGRHTWRCLKMVCTIPLKRGFHKGDKWMVYDETSYILKLVIYNSGYPHGGKPL